MASTKLVARNMWEYQWFIDTIVEDAINQEKSKEDSE